MSDTHTTNHARVQSGGVGLRGRGQVRPHRPVRVRTFHGEVRPHHRGLLPQGDRGGPHALRPRDPGHGRHGAVCVHAGPLHQERTGVHCGLQPDQPPNLPGHQDHEGPDHEGQGHGEGAHPAGRQQGGPGEPAGGAHGGGDGPGANLGLLLRREQRQAQDQRQRSLRGDRQRNELKERQSRPRDRVHLLCLIIVEEEKAVDFLYKSFFVF